jgi:hypothetical protein
MTEIEGKACTLRLAAQGRIEPCLQELCAFWEPGGAVVGGGCLVERLHIDLHQMKLARHLLETRERLEQARDLSKAEQAYLDLSRRIGLEL